MLKKTLLTPNKSRKSSFGMNFAIWNQISGGMLAIACQGEKEICLIALVVNVTRKSAFAGYTCKRRGLYDIAQTSNLHYKKLQGLALFQFNKHLP